MIGRGDAGGTGAGGGGAGGGGGNAAAAGLPTTPVPSLLIDLHELTMADASLARGHTEVATFSMFAPALPAHRDFLVAGRRVAPAHTLDELAAACRAAVACLPAAVQAVTWPATYPVAYTERLERMQRRLAAATGSGLPRAA